MVPESFEKQSPIDEEEEKRKRLLAALEGKRTKEEPEQTRVEQLKQALKKVRFFGKPPAKEKE